MYNPDMLLSKNRRAFYDYKILEKFMAGIKLTGAEVKAIREGKVSFEGSYVTVEGNEAILKSLYIGKYSKTGEKVGEDFFTRDRLLLLNRQEIDTIKKELKQKGKSAIPLAILLRNNFIKLEFAVVKGKKQFEKKHLEKERQIKKDLEKEARSYKNE
jgi:SsrA-binding protein